MAANIRSHSLKWLAIALGVVATVVSVCVSAGARDSGSNSHVIVLAALNAAASAAPVVRGASCSADVSGTWSGTLTFQGVRPRGSPQSVNAHTLHGARVSATTGSNGIFVWQLPGAQTCQLTMTSYRSGSARVDLAASGSTPSLLAQITTPPSYLPWYSAMPTLTPSPITGAYVGIGGAWGAGNIFNTGAGPDETPGTGMLESGLCYFACYGAPGTASHHSLAYGNDVDPGNTESYTHNGAPDDCTPTAPPGPASGCPGAIKNQVFSVTVDIVSPTPGAYFVTLDASGNLGTLKNLYAGAAVIAGAGHGSTAPVPSFTPGSLVSYTGMGKGDVLLGGTTGFVKCDYGETAIGIFTCNQPLVVSTGLTSAGFGTPAPGTVWATGGVQPSSISAGGSGGYAPEAFPLGIAAPHPQILSGSCTLAGGSGTCTFPNTFHFGDTDYNCTVSAQGTSPLAESYVRTSATTITIHSGSLIAATFSYICME
jgi:hypothetical protein